MIAIIDYGMGNLRSVQKAFEKVGHSAVITNNPQEVLAADGVLLPGVGAFGDAMDHLRQLGLVDPIKRVAAQDVPLLGICLGMQLLFTTSEEHGFHQGLDLIPGHVKRFRGDFKIPQVGWNSLDIQQRHPLLEGVRDNDYVYYVHSYYVEPVDRGIILASSNYHGEVPGVVGSKNVFGIQFHPEKSSSVGLRMLDNFGRMCRKGVYA
ncbi:imidazole glycerol phosphate synthase subunit HisH [Effusibacillus lacus]|uniref:Imidazole glycerol phosphate synthase subunit HisH n=1 Tax=Effusibacillus lacus TaxID=1348429 RepID=A0A292YPW5_9BACL|nr:imidazole glycerol phosphate synthase subunit HisH [Effusibacillus lacus]TCS74200.1 glutamine amidotransferase [Effusibacillus lacus]GAX90803.1 imidazole glycerol phosphate synthase subunit HisH [Effusibacillus lacus]